MDLQTAFSMLTLFMNVLFIVNLLNARTSLVNLNLSTAKFITPIGNIALMYDYLNVALDSTQKINEFLHIQNIILQLIILAIFAYFYVSIGLTILISYDYENPFVKIKWLRYSSLVGIALLFITVFAF